MDYVRVHEKYDNEWLKNDIAVIKVSKSIDLSQHTPVCLPRRNRKFVGSNATVTGWGVKSYFEGSRYFPDVLQEVSLTIHDSDFCGLSKSSNTNGELCAGGSGVGICFGDSGGPLTVEGGEGRHTLVGVSSNVLKDPCDVNLPGYFADVSYYRDWIKEKTGI